MELEDIANNFRKWDPNVPWGPRTMSLSDRGAKLIKAINESKFTPKQIYDLATGLEEEWDQFYFISSTRIPTHIKQNVVMDFESDKLKLNVGILINEFSPEQRYNNCDRIKDDYYRYFSAMHVPEMNCNHRYAILSKISNPQYLSLAVERVPGITPNQRYFLAKRL